MLEYNKLLFCIFIIIHTQIFYRINEFLSKDGALNFFFIIFPRTFVTLRAIRNKIWITFYF